MESKHIVHNLEPVYDSLSRVLILGSLPSVRSREQCFFYGHPQNRFWRVLAALFKSDVPQTISEKKYLLLENGIALWDVISECDIIGSSDASIKNVIPTDITPILDSANISGIFVNGAAAGKIYKKHQLSVTGREAAVLPSTSPANASWSFERLVEAWQMILKCEDKNV